MTLQPSESPTSPNVSSMSGAPLGPTTTVISGAAGMETAVYPSAIPGNPTLNSSLLGQATFKIDSKPGHFHNVFDTTIGKYVNWDQTVLDAREIYTEFNFNSDSHLSFGRQLNFWSEVDQNWKLGEYQPIYDTDPLRPTSDGLTGLFYRQRAGAFEFLAFASPISIPTTGPNVREQNGSLVSNGRWFTQPSQTASILGQNTQLVYSLNIPDLTSLLNHGELATRVLVGDHDKGFWASGSYGHKPLNNIQLKYDASITTSNTATVEVRPVIIYQDLWGADAGYASETSHVSVSFLEDDPIAQYPVNDLYSDWWQQQPNPMKIYGFHADTKAKLSAFAEPVVFGTDYLRAFESITWDVDAQGVARTDISPYRTQFSNAVSLYTEMSLRLAGRKLMTRVMALRDFDQSGNLYQTAFTWSYARQWLITAGVDTLQPDNISAGNTDGHFINQFRANDRVYGGFSYVF